MIEGFWLLQECTLAFSDGRPPKHPFQKGMICYSPHGYMQASLSVHPREDSSRTGLEIGHRLSSQEKEKAFDAYLSYGGRYTSDDREVTHFVDFSLNPSVIGTTLKRNYTLQENRLLLFYTHHVRSDLSISYSLHWIRAHK